jgi:hypothetical protein
MMNRGLYLQQLQRLLKYYDRDSVHLMIMEELESDYVGELSRLCGFLGVGEYGHEMEFKRTVYEPMPDGAREKLVSFYKPHNEELFGFLDRRIVEW